MSNNMPTNSLRRVTKKNIRPCHNLISNVNAQIVKLSKAHQRMHVLVNLLLPISKRAPANEFSAEMSGKRVNNKKLHIQTLLNKLVNLLSQYNLMVRIKSAGNLNAL